LRATAAVGHAWTPSVNSVSFIALGALVTIVAAGSRHRQPLPA